MLENLIYMIFGQPDLVIGEDYLERWYVIPRNRFFNIYLHKFTGSDDDRATHDHPWSSMSILLEGRIEELHKDKLGNHIWRVIPRFWPVFRSATFSHRLEVIDGPVWTLFITGPVVRDWGFHCPKRWKPWQEFTTPDGSKTGAGCGE